MRIVDRRLNPGGKSFSNRQRFLRRVRDTVERAVREASRERAIEDLESEQEVTVPADGAREPLFRHMPGERRDFVLPGNRDFVEGDLIDRPTGENGGGGAEPGRGHGQEDAFRFVLTREEFLSIFLDDLELPDFAKRGLVDTQKLGSRRAGYSTSGTPANLSLGRTMQMSLARRIAMGRPRRHTVERLEEEFAGAKGAEAAELLDEVLRTRARRMRIPFLDPVDLRYRRFERFPKPVAQAVMFCLMDVSGSMTEHMKDLAKRFFMLLHVFLTRRYQRVEIVFIRHTDEAQEVDEETFFRSAETGGTVVSSALVEMDRIIADRYDPASWNIYGAQASDGDNMMSDNDRTRALLQDKILPLCQYFAYLEVANTNESHSLSYVGGSSLWNAYAPLAATAQNFQMRRVSRRDHIYPVFRELFRRRNGAGAEEAR
ncbi:YeaH/YhbH family protein [Methylocystis sp. JAN1]|uniref:YeaH/YhbH family protein n=1 Tax=Methylocystis sp. JAN1 TaxID=3397211 RepID=UPI003FA1D0ED